MASCLTGRDRPDQERDRMGFMDKAKQMAEQAQQKIDEAQKKFNESQQQRSDQPAEGPAVEYDKHGRPIQQEAPAAPPPAPTAPAAGEPAAPAPPAAEPA